MAVQTRLGRPASALGKKAVDELQTKHKLNNVEFQQLDITDAKSISALGSFIKTKYGGLDILVNNAGMAFKGNAFDEKVARTTISTNYFGTLAVCMELLPLVRDGGRVVNVSSTVGTLSKLTSSQLQAKFLDPKLTIDELSALENKFILDVAKGTWKEEGWPTNTYAVSKIGVTALTRVLASMEKRNVLINAMCPGWVATDMAGPSATLTPDQGAETAIWLSSLPPSFKTSGGFFKEKTQRDWAAI